MTIANLFDVQEMQGSIARIEQLTNTSQPQWGKMSVAQMLAHLNVAYEVTYTDKHPKPGFLTQFFLRLFVKNSVVGPKPYKKNSPTAPIFKISDERDFEKEKKRLIEFIQKTQQLGTKHFDGKAYPNFGKLTANEWNTMFSKHLDHHLTQFGV